MRSEIIQIIPCNNYEAFSHLNSIISQKIVSLIFFKRLFNEKNDSSRVESK
jgi:hypothetical protein